MNANEFVSNIRSKAFSWTYAEYCRRLGVDADDLYWQRSFKELKEVSRILGMWDANVIATLTAPHQLKG